MHIKAHQGIIVLSDIDHFNRWPLLLQKEKCIKNYCQSVSSLPFYLIDDKVSEGNVVRQFIQMFSGVGTFFSQLQDDFYLNQSKHLSYYIGSPHLVVPSY